MKNIIILTAALIITVTAKSQNAAPIKITVNSLTDTSCVTATTSCNQTEQTENITSVSSLNELKLRQVNNSFTHATISVMNTTGSVVMKENVTINAGASAIKINASKIPAGVYAVKIMSDNGNLDVVKFIKQ